MLKQSAKTALGGVSAALMLALMFLLSIFPSATISAPAVASVVMVFVVLELGKGWAFGVYAAAAILAVLVLPSKEAAVLFAVFFGYYPILKAALEKKALRRILEWTIKLVLFLSIISVSYYLMIRFMGVEFEEIGKYGKAAIPVLLGFGAIAFVAYDFCLTLFVSEYLRRWQRRFRRRFRL
jgi:MFS family permease